MSRTRAEALALVNWKGVFYERYTLDRHVTALEGANGAGKTTVMIAAYVVLLPDLARLRFTNLGETGATGGDKGIWGRLGERGRPSYAVLDFALPRGERVLAGVHLERKGEPALDATPFIVTGLADDVRLQDVLLVQHGDSELVPELSELRETAARAGGRLQSFNTAREYFATLFELGVTPLRLGTDEERNKLNEMLRTSMTGGISRALTSELRTFLLKEEAGLAETLQRMRANLDACRRTRTEVHEARRLEREIGGVFEAGQVMFAAAFLALRERADEQTRRVTEAEAAELASAEVWEAAEAALGSTLASLDQLDGQRIATQTALAAAEARYQKLTSALLALAELEVCRDSLAATLERLESADTARGAARAQLERCRADSRAAEEGYSRAAAGLADLQRGLEELHRRAGAYRHVTRRLGEARATLGPEGLPSQTETGFSDDAGACDARLDAARAELRRTDDERREVSTRSADAESHAKRHSLALRALETLAGAPATVENASALAEAELARFRAAALLASRLPAIEQDLAEAEHLAARQAAARARAVELGLDPAQLAPSARAALGASLEAAEDARRGHEEAARAHTSAAADALRRSRELSVAHSALVAQQPEWAAFAERAARIASFLGAPLDDRDTLRDARARLSDLLAALRAREASLGAEAEQLLETARELSAAGGPYPAELLRLRDALGATLFAAAFEDVGLDEAALLEARLGSLAQALVVDNVEAAALQAAERSEALEQVIFVPRDADALELSAATQDDPGARDVWVHEGVSLRVTRKPDHPRLGRRAREARAEQLRALAEQRTTALDAVRSERRQVERLVTDGDALLAGQAVWLAGDPAPRIQALASELEACASTVRASNEAARTSELAARAEAPRIEALRALLGEALLLDPPDHGERRARLAQERADASAARERVTHMAEPAAQIERELATLRLPPLAPSAIAALQQRADELRARRNTLEAGIEALEEVRANLPALGWSEAPRRLADEERLLPALRAQLDEAAALRRSAEAAAELAQARLDERTAAFQDADGDRRVAAKAHAAADEAFRAIGVAEPTESERAAAHAEADRHTQALAAHEARRDALLTARGRDEAAVREAAARLAESREALTAARREAEPAVRRWNELRKRAEEASLVGGLLDTTGPAHELADVRGHVNLLHAAHTRREVLYERLRAAHGGAALLAELQLRRDVSDAAFADVFVDLWLAVRDWLRRRLPAQIAEVDDPREALQRLADQLNGLEERLQRQEDDLRGASEDVARGIDVHIRKARGQTNRLNTNLEGVRFGSIQGIRVRLSIVERMEQVLRALRGGEAQALLFQADLPFEEALEEIFRRYGGGRTGGQRLLDYREYVQLTVEVRRKTGAEWELANPTRLSTGEAIGVGAALMMVVLTEWERDATLLRGRRQHGSLRFLFLDEANRLSHDNLGVLFDLCQTLDLQLLIAAPEVARAEGNTTYRLVRRATADGREEVMVTGRRTRTEA